MMAELLCIPLKKTSDLDLVKPLRNIIASIFSTADNQESLKYTEAIQDFNKLRNNAVWKTLDKHESSLEALYKYYDQLAALEEKIPPAEVQIPFNWMDAFDRGSFFGGKISLSTFTSYQCKSCILYALSHLVFVYVLVVQA
ncbi:unnamed protein product [Darwinula stevensoni]|uniref:BRO1 domain-containing protein n=1 Tax=Darwinula stevensoni TaxID=69355 RepID=A0A7R9AG38_9CRUS|nr:unnamed protein product [Darwinula stevensoni]CAG0903923.1 unnamed protein product [Darwinula stevensoni]